MHELNAGTSYSRFKMIPFCKYNEDDPRYVRGGVVLTLKHSELGGLLSSDDNDFTNDGLAEVFLWVYKGKEEDVENFNTQSLFEVEIAQDTDRGMIARTSDDETYQHKYRLRHLNTGRLCTVQTIDFKGEKIVTLGLAEHLKLQQNPKPLKAGDTYRIADSAKAIKELEDNTLFSFVPTTVDDDKMIKNFSCVQIQHCKSSKKPYLKKTIIRAVPEHEIQCNLHSEEKGGSYRGRG
jgi:hypothetical protein